MGTAYYRSGQAGTMLGISSHSVRRLCEAGLIEAEQSDGGQWRVPASEVERLKREGVPPIPSSIEPDCDEEEEAEGDNSGEHGLLAPPSKNVVTSAEDVVVAENRLKKLKIDRETEETRDWFRQRATSQQEAEEQEWEAELERRERFQAEHARTAWLDQWLAIALAALPQDAPPNSRLEVRETITEVLARLGPQNSANVVRPLVEAGAAKALQPWLKGKESASATEAAVNTLPSRATNYFTPTVWQVRAREEATAAIRKLPWDSPYDEKVSAGTAAVQPICHAFEDSERREGLVQGLLWDIDYSQWEEARESIRAAFEKLPSGTTEKALERAREQALVPFRESRKQRQRDANNQQKVELKLFRVRRYLEEMQQAGEIDFENYLELWEFADSITPQIRVAVLKELRSRDLSDERIEALIEQLVEESLDE